MVIFIYGYQKRKLTGIHKDYLLMEKIDTIKISYKKEKITGKLKDYLLMKKNIP